MVDLQELIFGEPSRVTDREVLATARLNARVRAFAGRELSDDVIKELNAAIAEEANRLISDGVLEQAPDWLAVMLRRRLYVAFGYEAVCELARELRSLDAF